jgi:Fe-S-cluster-containing dehydrogenase component
MKAFVIDVSHCNGCYCCQIACKDKHVGNDWTPYAVSLQPVVDGERLTIRYGYTGYNHVSDNDGISF